MPESAPAEGELPDFPKFQTDRSHYRAALERWMRRAFYPTRDEMVARYEQASGRAVLDPHYWEVFGAMRFCTVFIRLGDRLTAAGFVPPERNPAVGNQVTAALAVLLGIDNPTPDLLTR